MKRGVLLDGPVVKNVCVFEEDFDGTEWDGFDVVWVADEVRVEPGWVVDGNGFANPNEPVVSVEEQRLLVESARRIGYTHLSDPLFFEWQRGTGTQQAWLDAVQSVRDSNPYPDPV